ncbi:hypothetical protein ACQ4PT_063333 [Festuca glaucescens]
MATQGAVRLIGGAGAGGWSSKGFGAFDSSLGNLPGGEGLGFVDNGSGIYGAWRESVPDRSGSAPPSMEGSLAALGNLIGQRSGNFDASLGNLDNVTAVPRLRSSCVLTLHTLTIMVPSADQHGSRFIQQKLENCTAEEKASVFAEVLPHAPSLMTDVFGNYVIQKFFEHGTPEQRRDLATKLAGHVLPLSLQMYGCRVIQKALEVMELDQKIDLVCELDGNIIRCVRDQNGNHVIQKCIECVPTEHIGFVVSAFRGQVASLSMHPYGCRVIQRVLEHCGGDSQGQCIIDEILQSACILAQDQYGNYVTQGMMKDQYANYVVQKILEACNDQQRELLVSRVKGHLQALRKYTYGKHIASRVEQLCGEGGSECDS